MIRWRCPKCRSTSLGVYVTTLAALKQSADPHDNNFETEAYGDHEWSESSFMTCCECEYLNVASKFEVGS